MPSLIKIEFVNYKLPWFNLNYLKSRKKEIAQPIWLINILALQKLVIVVAQLCNFLKRPWCYSVFLSEIHLYCLFFNLLFIACLATEHVFAMYLAKFMILTLYTEVNVPSWYKTASMQFSNVWGFCLNWQYWKICISQAKPLSQNHVENYSNLSKPIKILFPVQFPRSFCMWNRKSWIWLQLYAEGIKKSYICCCCCSVSQSYLTPCSPMDCSMSGFSVLHHLPESAPTHVQWVSDAIQNTSHPLSSPSPPAFNLSQHQSLFQ